MRVSFCAPRPDRPVATLLANCGGCLRCIRRSLLCVSVAAVSRLVVVRREPGHTGCACPNSHCFLARAARSGPELCVLLCRFKPSYVPSHSHSLTKSQPASSPLRGRLRGSVPLPDRSVVDGGRVFARRGIVNLRMGQGSRHGRARNAPLRPSLCPLFAAWRASGCREMGMASRAPPPSTSSPRCRCSRGWRSSRLTP